MIYRRILKIGTRPSTEARHTSEIIFEDVYKRQVLVGEVWLVSGQSNAALMTNKALTWEEDSKALDNPNLRVFTQSVRPVSYTHLAVYKRQRCILYGR